MARTDTLGNFLTDVADAIREKKGTSETIQASDFDTEIANLPSGGDTSEYFDSEATDSTNGSISAGYWITKIKKLPKLAKPYAGLGAYFANFKGESLDETIKDWNTTNVTAMDNLFDYCTNLKSVNISHFDTSNVKRIGAMFRSCINIESIPFFDTQNVTNMSYAFYGCEKITSIPEFNTEKVQNFSNCMRMCTMLEDVPLLNTSSVTNFQYMFSNCNNLTDTSIDNILQMCINATRYNGTKTLVQLGFSSSMASASRIQALPHYQDFINANWTIGY